MFRLKFAIIGGLVALSLTACGIKAKPLAGTSHLNRARGNHARLDDPRFAHDKCLRAHGIPFHRFRASGDRPSIQIGSKPIGPTIVFEPTPGGAQYLQIAGEAQAAEVIGSALLYPNLASDAELKQVEKCVQLGVTG